MAERGIAAGHSLIMGGTVGEIGGMPDADQRTLHRLLDVWADKYPRNRLRGLYYDAKEPLSDFGIAVPPRISRSVRAPLGWPRLAVRALADKTAFEGFDVAGQDTLGIAALASGMRLDTVLDEAVVSAYKHSCAFLTIDFDPSDPTGKRIQVIPRAADWASALWDNEHMRISAAMTITSTDSNGVIDGLNLWLPGRNYHAERRQGAWSAAAYPTGLSVPAVVPIAYDRQMDRPFGRSRITRALMAQTDMAFRTMVLMETDAQYYAAPKLWFLGVDSNAADGLKAKSRMDMINAVGKSTDGTSTVPTLTQVTQASMQPLGQMLQTIGMLVASETGIPAEQLGIYLSNPTSADALAASEEQLSRQADRQNREYGHALMDVLRIALALRDGHAPDLSNVRPIFAPTREASDGARADWYSKVSDAYPVIASSTVGLRRLGLSLDEIKAVREAEREQEAAQAVAQIRAQVQAAGLKKQQAREEANGRQPAEAESGQPAAGQAQPGAAE